MKTNRLYYDNAYLTEFDAVVILADGNKIALDQSAFYPTSGGQPFDTGRISFGERFASVKDVTVEDDIVWHHLDQPVPVGTKVHGIIDWDRRFEHMQQHAGDHMIAGTVWELFRGVTIGLHTGQTESTIDITMPEGKTHLTEAETLQVETLVNQRIQMNAPIRCWFPDASELAALPIRKKPTVTEHIRIVAMGDFEMVACGGTHPSTTGQIGLVKILSTAPSRGNMRLTFVAGMRALQHYQASFTCAREISARLSSDIPSAPAALDKLLESNNAALKDTQSKLMQASLQAAMQSVREINETHVYACHLPFADASVLQQIAKALIAKEKTMVLLSCQRDNGCLVLFARSNDVNQDMAQLLRACGVRGGGKPDFAQGSAPDEQVLVNALSLL